MEKVFERSRADIIDRILFFLAVLVLQANLPQVRGARSASSLGQPQPAFQEGRIVFLGTSLTAGYGLQDPDRAYPGLIAERLAEEGLSCRVDNAGVSGDTSSGGRTRLGWILEEPLTLLFIELGANDGLRGLDTEQLQQNLAAIIRETKRLYPTASVALAGMEAPPNFGSVYTERFRSVFKEVSDQEGTPLVPFLLEDVAGTPELNLPDGIHPNPKGHEIVANNVWSVLADLFRASCASGTAAFGP